MAINAISSALSAMQRQSVAMDRAAEKIGRAAATDVTAVPQSQEHADLIGAHE